MKGSNFKIGDLKRRWKRKWDWWFLVQEQENEIDEKDLMRFVRQKWQGNGSLLLCLGLNVMLPIRGHRLSKGRWWRGAWLLRNHEDKFILYSKKIFSLWTTQADLNFRFSFGQRKLWKVINKVNRVIFAIVALWMWLLNRNIGLYSGFSTQRSCTS